MEGVGPGSVLAGRFTLTSLVRDANGAQRWTADEPDLGRSVAVLLLPVTDPRSEALLDAARVAASLDVLGCVRILDIGQEGAVSYVVEESLSDARSVADLVGIGGVPGDEVRRIVGEAASALEAASSRGVHHLRLGPDEVFRTTDGAIKVRGLATEAVLAAVEQDPVSAARTDAVDLVALTYAALTGLWPLTRPTSLANAPRGVRGVPSPSELAAGIPRDLDTLCRLTLGDGAGPVSPGDYARQIAPWSSRQITGRSTLPAAPAVPVTPPPASESRSITQPASAAPTAASPANPSAAPVPSEPSAPQASASAASTTPDPAPAASAPDTGAGTADGAAVGLGSPVVTAAAAAATGVAAGTPGAAQALSSAVTPSAAVSPSAGSVAGLPSDGSAGSQVGQPTGSTRSSTGPSPVPPHGDRSPRTPSQNDRLEPPAPGLPAEPLSRDRSWLALALVALFVLGALWFGINGVSKIGSQTNLDLSGGAVDSSTAPTPSPSAEAPTTLNPLAILSADGFDPLGDGRENNNLAPRVFDGNTETAWTSEGYRSANLGGLKAGVGLVVDIGPNVAAKEVSVNLGAPATVQVYLATDRVLDGALLIGEQADASGVVTFTADEGVDTTGRQYVIVWFTNVSQVSDGAFRAVINEVSVLG